MKDTYELPISTSTVAAGDAFNRALVAFAGFDADVVERVQAVQKADPAFALGHCLWGYVMMLAYSRAALPVAEEAARTAAAHAAGATPREQAHVRALERWVAGDVDGALREWEAILATSPRDLLALRLAHANYFWAGRGAEMRPSLERVASHWGDRDSGFLACLAFALEETGDYEAAERTGRRAVELDPTEVWGAHAVAHVLEMQRRSEEGVAWLAGLEPNWNGKGAFLHHLWWHRAMFHLARREFDTVLDLYDRRIRNLQSPLVTALPDFHVDVQNAASMLFRLELRGVPVEGRWSELAEKAEARIGDQLSVWTLPHWMMALAAEGRDAQSRLMLKALAESENRAVREVALPVCQAVLAHRRGEHERVVALMTPVRNRLAELGGSHAQRDVVAQLYADSRRRVERVAA
ncbi:MAG TPA: tetratricopeptide repeat protein [Burkholderiales bacterium]|nr:tetratricopeptide repeat protein [Burkholderiales bacterium]